MENAMARESAGQICPAPGSSVGLSYHARSDVVGLSHQLCTCREAVTPMCRALVFGRGCGTLPL
jgi:hypothetical protein